MSPRPHLLKEANHRQLRERPPRVAVLPWGATEAHNEHLPYGTDIIEAEWLGEKAAAAADAEGAHVVTLPAIPFGNDEQQLDQAATISIQTRTAEAILDDVARSLMAQGVDRLVVLNAHGGNEFKPLVRDISQRRGMLVVVTNFFQMIPEALHEIFDEPGDHAGAMETAFLLHVCPDLVVLEQAGDGRRIPFQIEGIRQAGVWTPRPWSHTHPDTGSGDPRTATADQGAQYLERLVPALAHLLIGLSSAEKGDLPYV